MGRTVVVGAGLAGLAAAEALSRAGREVLVLEASPKAGGRCRTYRDERLGRDIDNGNHLILSANRAVLGWAERTGGAEALEVRPEAAFPFLDAGAGHGWTLRLAPGPLGALRGDARPPGVPARAVLRDLAAILTARRGRTVAEAVCARSALWERFWDPMVRAILNEDPAEGDAALMRAVLLRTFARGGGACRPVLAPQGLGPALVDPALGLLKRRGVRIDLRTPVKAVARNDGRATALETREGTVAVGATDDVIVALPAAATGDLLPELALPGPGKAILNAHFVLPGSRLPPVLGLVGGEAQWLFRRGDVVSVTVSAAERSPLEGLDRDAALARLWSDVAAAVRAHGGTVPDAMPAARLIRERAATFDQTPAGSARRHGHRTRWANLFLAGDHTDTGLPATLEGAILSGERAAALALRQRRAAPVAVEHRVQRAELRQQP